MSGTSATTFEDLSPHKSAAVTLAENSAGSRRSAWWFAQLSASFLLSSSAASSSRVLRYYATVVADVLTVPSDCIP